MIKLNGLEIKPTIFPDGSSQVWKLPVNKVCNPEAKIEWTFQNEAEIIHVLQLADLVNACTAGIDKVKLKLDFLPYSRQDKNITNDSTFALKTFLNVLFSNDSFSEVSVIDVHSYNGIRKYSSVIRNEIPNDRIKEVITEITPDLIVFPDDGASHRGYDTQGIQSFNLMKKRNQSTGEIEGLKTSLPLNLTGLSILILDDITDGGRTFIEASKLLKELGANKVSLYTTHGIYSKGTQVLFDAGLDRIFNYNGEVARQS